MAHGQAETSHVPRIVWAIAHLGIVGATAWMYFFGGIEIVGGWFGQEWKPAPDLRLYILIAMGIVLWIRMIGTAFVLLQRKFGWDEAIPVTCACAFYHFGFALTGGHSQAAVGPLEYAGIAVFILGSYFNTGSELQRKKFKADPANKGKLFTTGLFGIVRHPNYLGDTLWTTGWAMVSHSPWAAIMPVASGLAFMFGFIPSLTKYLEEKYGDQYTEWAKTTPRFIPFIW